MQLICGMHRSGTSLVAKLFHSAGANMGDPCTFYAADQWNPAGYYEQLDVLRLNISLLHGNWGRLAYLHLPNAATIMKRGTKYAANIAELGLSYADRIVKENRFCLTLPAWRANGGDVRRVIVCMREPVAVALSLKRRNRIPIWYSYRLWLKHIASLLQNCEGLDTWFVRYEALLNPATKHSEAIGALRFFEMDLPVYNESNLLDGNIIPQLNNAPVVMKTRYPHAVQRLWDELLARHARQTRL